RNQRNALSGHHLSAPVAKKLPRTNQLRECILLPPALTPRRRSRQERAMKRMLATLSIVLACAALPACATKQGTGAVIGAGTGAAAGAAIAKNNALGAVVGGVVGGLVGGAIGRHTDNTDQQHLAQTFETNPTGRSSEWTNPDTG